MDFPTEMTESTVQIAAFRGSRGEVDAYLLVPADADLGKLAGVPARILHPRSGEISAVMPALRAVKRGYWRGFTGGDVEVQAALEVARRADADS